MVREYTDAELDRDTISLTRMPDGTVVRVLPDDHPLILEQRARYRVEAQARRDAARIDWHHHFASDDDQAGMAPYLDGVAVPDATECYTGDPGWVVHIVRDAEGRISVGDDDVSKVRRIGRVELRPKEATP